MYPFIGGQWRRVPTVLYNLIISVHLSLITVTALKLQVLHKDLQMCSPTVHMPYVKRVSRTNIILSFYISHQDKVSYKACIILLLWDASLK